jgi:hypothetical protein
MGNGNFCSGGKKADMWSRPFTSMIKNESICTCTSYTPSQRAQWHVYITYTLYILHHIYTLLHIWKLGPVPLNIFQHPFFFLNHPHLKNAVLEKPQMMMDNVHGIFQQSSVYQYAIIRVLSMSLAFCLLLVKIMHLTLWLSSHWMDQLLWGCHVYAKSALVSLVPPYYSCQSQKHCARHLPGSH